MSMQFKNPTGGTPSTIGTQINNWFYVKKALVELPKLQYFSQLADVQSMPKNFGKKIKRYHYMPLLDDRNINDQGIDAAGVTLSTQYYVTIPSTVLSIANASKATLASALNDNLDGVTAVAGANDSAGTGFATVTVTGSTTFKVANSTKANAITSLNIGASSVLAGGNLYGSSKDVGTISGKMPALSETGGRVNRVGFKRIELEGTLEKFGFFDEYTQESLDFDTDEALMEHIHREMLLGANEMTEDALQIDLLNSAGVVRYAGSAVSNATVDDTCVLTYGDLMRTSIQLDQNRCPKQTKVITGSRMIDTKVIPSGRVAYIGSELIPTVKAMKDLHNNPAFIGVERYGAATVTLNGEIGTIDQMRLVVVPEMMRWAGAGADATSTATCHETGGRYDVFPVLVVGDESFTTIGFQTDGKTVKFKIMHKAPGEATATTLDPYGETGFMSIKWYYGFMCLRPERLALIKTVGKL